VTVTFELGEGGGVCCDFWVTGSLGITKLFRWLQRDCNEVEVGKRDLCWFIFDIDSQRDSREEEEEAK